MPIRSWVVGIAAFAVLAPAARAQQCRSIPECLARAGLSGHPDPLFALVTAAAAAPVILAGALATATGQLRADAERPLPPGVVQVTPPPAPPSVDQEQPAAQGPPPKPRLELALIPVPAPPPPPAPPTSAELRHREQQRKAVQLNDTLTNVGLAVGGAALIGSIVGGIVQSVKHK